MKPRNVFQRRESVDAAITAWDDKETGQAARLMRLEYPHSSSIMIEIMLRYSKIAVHPSQGFRALAAECKRRLARIRSSAAVATPIHQEESIISLRLAEGREFPAHFPPLTGRCM